MHKDLGAPTETTSNAPLELIDSHAHIDMHEFDADREAMLARARAAGVRAILAIGGDIRGDIDTESDGQAATSPAGAASRSGTDSPSDAAGVAALGSSLRFAEQHDWIYAGAGIHPHNARLAAPAHYEALERLARNPRFLAWGEIGLDYHYDFSPRDVQQRVFTEQLGLARAARKPVIIHCREAWPDCLALLESHWRPAGLGGIFHCFGGTEAEARQGIDMGFLVSFAGNATYPKAQNLRDVAAALPVDGLLIETDSPYLAPQGRRGKRNEPAYVAELARTLGPVRNLAPEEFAAATSANFRRFFGLGAS